MTVHPTKTQISLGISLRCVLNGLLRTQAFFMGTANTLIRLGRCPGWSESSFGAHVILLVLSCGGSYGTAYTSFPVSNNNMKLLWWFILKWHLSHLMTKPTKWSLRPVRTPISLGVCPVWSDSLGRWGPNVSLCGEQRLWSDWVDAVLIWVFSTCKGHFVGFVVKQLILCLHGKK